MKPVAHIGLHAAARAYTPLIDDDVTLAFTVVARR